jgi:hypothetical protein
MRRKRGVTIIKKLLFFSASLSIIVLGAVWMLLFQEPMADTMTKAPPPKKRALAYEQALATQTQNEADAPKAATKPKSDDVAKAEAPVKKTLAAAQKNAGNDAIGQPAPNPQVAALPQGPTQPAPGAPAPHALPWLNEQGDSVVVPQGQQGAANPQTGSFFDAPQQNTAGAGQPYGQNQQYGQQPPPYGPPPQGQGQGYGPGQPYDRTAAANPNPNFGQRPYPGGGGSAAQQGGYPGYPPPQPSAQQQYPPGGQYPPGQVQQGQYPPPGQYAPGQGQQPGYGARPYGQPQQEWAKVIVSGSGMRLNASEDSPVLFAFPYGRDLKVVSRNGEWVEVADPNSNAKGWIQAYALGPSAGPPQYGQAGDYYGEQPFEQPRRRRGGFVDMINRAFGGRQ